MVCFTEYSVGAIYLIIQNLPRAVRYKRENIILVGLIPGPKEPKLTMNSYLKPLVEELKQLWSGVFIPCPSHPLKQIFIRGALTCCACDIPATRKLCGFVGHNATMGCSKCNKEFLSFRSGGTINVDKRDFSGFDRENWPIRDISQHRQQAYDHLTARTKVEQQCIEKRHGVRYSCLLELPYWDPIKFSVVDPMHNLFLGTAKHVLQVWIDNNLITKKQFYEIETTVAKIVTPRSVGRIPLKISSGFSGFTADQWRNWITVFSPVALKTILPANHLRCWLLFVRACNLVCKRIITTQAIDEVDKYLLQFCKQFQELYGPESCTPNMHLQLHLKESLYNFGPVHSFWCFSFERLNGILGRFHTNNQSIEVQLMRKFLREADIHGLSPPKEAKDMFDMCNSNLSGSLHENNLEFTKDVLELQALAEHSNLNSNYSLSPNSSIYLLPPLFKQVLSANETNHLNAVYSYIYSDINIQYFSSFCVTSKKCNVAKELFSSSSIVTAFWPTESWTLPEHELQVGYVQKFLKHSIKVIENEKVVEKIHIFCIVEWYMKHSNSNHFGASAIVCMPFTYAANACQIMPIQKIANRCAYSKLNVNISDHGVEQVIVAIPLHLTFHI